jgi:hypothetical protein
MIIEKEKIGLAGEYGVASELCKRGFYAQLTLGNHKKTDLLVEDGQKLFRVSVKSKQASQWPNVRGIWQEGDLLVLVDFKDTEENSRPDYYVLTVKDWKKVVKKLKDKFNDGGKIDRTNTLYWGPWKGNPKGFRGCPVSIQDVKAYKDRWPKFGKSPRNSTLN